MRWMISWGAMASFLDLNWVDIEAYLELEHILDTLKLLLVSIQKSAIGLPDKLPELH